MCWECGDWLAVNGMCFHMNPNPERLREARRAQGCLTCPDCGATLEATINAEGKITLTVKTHN
jgi:hypothetical protein